MNRAAKTIIGVLLLSISGFYILFTVLIPSFVDSYSRKVYQKPFLQMECASVEKLGDAFVNEWGKTVTADEGFEIYCLNIKAENLSTAAERWDLQYNAYFAGTKDDPYSIVRQIDPADGSESCLFYQAAECVLPGRRETIFPVYLEVSAGTEEITGYFYPNENEKKREMGVIRLE